MKYFLIIIYSTVFFEGRIIAQDSLWISGRLIDAETKLPLKNVSITVVNTLYGTISDGAGVFTLQVKDKMPVLNFSILGYEKKTVNVKAGTKEPLTIELVPKASQLAEISISASAIETVSKSKRYHVLDYDFYKDNILMITYVDLNKAKLVLITTDSDTLGYKKIPYEPNRLFKDCLGNLHVVCKDSIYQAFYNGSTLSLLPAKSIHDFEKILLPCVAQDSSGFYMVEKYGGGQMIDVGIGAPVRANDLALSYVCIDKKKRQRTRFIIIADEHKMTMRNDEVAFEKRKEESGLKTFGDRLFAEKLLFTEIYAPLFKIRDSIYIFDYVNGNIKSFDKALQLKQEVPVSYHNNLRFQEEMPLDDISRKIYALFESGGISELQEINLNSGAVDKTYQIPFPFVNHIKVRGGYAYFIRKEKGDDQTRFLSRMRLD
jgi:hypothetical protein